MDEPYAQRPHVADAVLNPRAAMNGSMSNRDVLDVRIRPHIHAQYGQPSKPDGVTSDERLSSLSSSLRRPSVSAIHDVDLMPNRSIIKESSASPQPTRVPNGMLIGDRDIMDAAYAPNTHVASAVLNRDVFIDSMLSRDVSDVRIWSHIHGPPSVPEGMTSDERLYPPPSILLSQGRPSVSGMHDADAILNRDLIDDLPELGSDISFAAWRSAPWNCLQLPKVCSSTEITVSTDHQDNVIPFTGLPMLKQHQITMDDGSIKTYFALPRDSAMESRASHGKHTSPHNSSSSPQVTQGGVDANNLREEFTDNGSLRRIQHHSGQEEGVNILSRKHGLLPTDEDCHKKSSIGLGRTDNLEFDRRVRREWEDLSCAIKDANRVGEECRGPAALSLASRKGMDFNSSHDYLNPHDDDHMTVEEFCEHVYEAFMKYVKVLNEYPEERSRLEKQGKGGTLLCLACKRYSKPYLDTHSLVMHTFMSRKRALRAEHSGLRKAICTVMGWSSTMEPDFGKRYQHITSQEARMKEEDLILWPPALVIHNSYAEYSENGARDAAETAVEDLFRDAGLSFSGIQVVVGNAGSLIVEYSASSSCLLEAERLHRSLAAKGCGRDAWLRKSAAGHLGIMPTGKRILYGYLACAHDLHLVDGDFRRHCRVLSRKRFSAFSSLV